MNATFDDLKKEFDPGLEFEESRPSAVTTAWGVNWDEVYIARDIMQNFYDANRHCLKEIRVITEGDKVVVDAPTPFDLERLFYLGSEKGTEDVGHYGEGFKVAALCLLRDFKIEPVAVSGNRMVRMRISAETVGGTELQPMIYDFFKSARKLPGSRVILRHCPPRLVAALKAGLTHFFYDGNSLLGPRLWSSRDEEFAIYKANSSSGHVFYRNLRRGQIPGIPLALVIRKECGRIENKVKRDRDRNAFGESLMETFYGIFAGSVKYDTGAQRIVVDAGRSCWTSGHPLLNEIAGKSHTNGVRSAWSPSLSKEVFGNGFYARSTTHDEAERLEFAGYEREWEKADKVCLPSYFSRFGVLNARERAAELRARALRDAKSKHHRQPTSGERHCLTILNAVFDELQPEVAAMFRRGYLSYTVAETEALLGELKEKRSYREHSVFFSATLFLADFPEALAVFVHEHSHIFGYDGSRGFTDALTELLEAVVRERQLMGDYETQWNEARKKVRAERQRAAKSEAGNDVKTDLQELSADELRDILGLVPDGMLQRVMKNRGKERTEDEE